MSVISIIIVFSLLFIVVCAALIILWIFIVLLWTRVPYVKTPRKNIELLLRELQFKNSDVVFDLGCGDADVLIAIDKASQAKTIGYEISPFAYVRARWNIRSSGAHTELHFKKFQKADVSSATHIFLFLIVGVMEKTEDWLRAHAKKGVTIVCYGFSLPTLQPLKTIETNAADARASKFYIYVL